MHIRFNGTCGVDTFFVGPVAGPVALHIFGIWCFTSRFGRKTMTSPNFGRPTKRTTFGKRILRGSGNIECFILHPLSAVHLSNSSRSFFSFLACLDGLFVFKDHSGCSKVRKVWHTSTVHDSSVRKTLLFFLFLCFFFLFGLLLCFPTTRNLMVLREEACSECGVYSAKHGIYNTIYNNP